MDNYNVPGDIFEHSICAARDRENNCDRRVAAMHRIRKSQFALGSTAIKDGAACPISTPFYINDIFRSPCLHQGLHRLVLVRSGHRVGRGFIARWLCRLFYWRARHPMVPDSPICGKPVVDRQGGESRQTSVAKKRIGVRHETKGERYQDPSRRLRRYRTSWLHITASQFMPLHFESDDSIQTRKKRAPGLKIFLTRSGHLKSTLILTTVSII
ncbi:hypothetical protein GCT13_36940 [Paraburkholderia sp. CNPSo 3157]|uniref:Uncharacterized protein n=1 Tax=Paraburkholderia franconis TaxID=2654983 RepID=A0A7X1NIR3_9BURK|nr:hypothetical protein [Paraburkholderia franconis]MPW22268.1 hypothetical protein [Paraburkholderia franconis]